jgi:VanZ family protein
LRQTIEMVKKNIFSIFVALIILYLSLASSDTFNKVPLIDIPNLDKVIHFFMYFGLMSVITIENRRTIISNKQLFLVALIPLFYGLLMELLQLTLTSTRSCSFFDVVFNSAGIIVSILLWLCFKPLLKERLK